MLPHAHLFVSLVGETLLTPGRTSPVRKPGDALLLDHRRPRPRQAWVPRLAAARTLACSSTAPSRTMTAAPPQLAAPPHTLAAHRRASCSNHAGKHAMYEYSRSPDAPVLPLAWSCRTGSFLSSSVSPARGGCCTRPDHSLAVNGSPPRTRPGQRLTCVGRWCRWWAASAHQRCMGAAPTSADPLWVRCQAIRGTASCGPLRLLAAYTRPVRR